MWTAVDPSPMRAWRQDARRQATARLARSPHGANVQYTCRRVRTSGALLDAAPSWGKRAGDSWC